MAHNDISTTIVSYNSQEVSRAKAQTIAEAREAAQRDRIPRSSACRQKQDESSDATQAFDDDLVLLLTAFALPEVNLHADQFIRN